MAMRREPGGFAALVGQGEQADVVLGGQLPTDIFFDPGNLGIPLDVDPVLSIVEIPLESIPIHIEPKPEA